MSGVKRVALVTGAASGIGRATALQFAKAGCCVVCSDVADVKQVVDAITACGGDALGVHCDVSQEADVIAMIDAVRSHYGRLDYAYNNAGISHASGQTRRLPLHEMPVADFDEVMNINLRGAFLCMKHQIPLMLANPPPDEAGRCIMLTASVLSHVGSGRMPAYVASKHALTGLAKQAALDYGPLGIRINCVSPGTIRTAMTATMECAVAAGDAPVAPMARVPLGRMGEPSDVASYVVWCCMQGAYVTGADLLIDGGVLCKSSAIGLDD